LNEHNASPMGHAHNLDLGRNGKMTFQKIFIMGAGAVGSCYGALLSRKNDVTLIGRQSHVDAINSKGLIIDGGLKGKFHLKTEVAIFDVPANSLILLTMKAQDAAKTCEALQPMLRSNTVLLALQNGLAIKELILNTIAGKAKVVRGLVLMAAEFLEPGKITYWKGPTIIEKTEIGKEIQALFEGSGLETEIASDIRRQEWNKMVINCIVNPLSAILKVRDHEVAAPGLRGTRRSIIRECALVAEAEGIHFGDGLEANMDNRIKCYKNYSSMYQDITKGKDTEIGFLNAKIVELGNKHGIRVPVNETLVELIRFMEAQK